MERKSKPDKQCLSYLPTLSHDKLYSAERLSRCIQVKELFSLGEEELTRIRLSLAAYARQQEEKPDGYDEIKREPLLPAYFGWRWMAWKKVAEGEP